MPCIPFLPLAMKWQLSICFLVLTGSLLVMNTKTEHRREMAFSPTNTLQDF